MNLVQPIEYKNERRLKLLEVDESVVHDLAQQIMKINDEDEQNEQLYKNYVREPIKLTISSYGGNVYDGLSLIAAMRASKTEIHTYVTGMAMSMGLVISVWGHKRYADKYATYMWHDIASMNVGKLEEMEQSAEQLKGVRTVLNGMIVERTKVKADRIKEMIKSKQDWYMTADEAKKQGICDHIV